MQRKVPLHGVQGGRREQTHTDTQGNKMLRRKWHKAKTNEEFTTITRGERFFNYYLIRLCDQVTHSVRKVHAESF